MSSIGRFTTRLAVAAGVVGVFVLMVVPVAAPASAVGAPRQATTAPPTGPVASGAIDALRLERDLVHEGGQLPRPIPRELSEQIRAADEAGAPLLEALERGGYIPSANLIATLGSLPPPTGPIPPQPPLRDAYDAAIRELGGDPGPELAAEPAPVPAAPPASSPARSTSTSTSTTALVVAVLALLGLALVVAGLLVRRRADKRLIAEAMTDSLTGLFNRRRLDNDLLSCSTKRTPVGVLMVDVDNFKSFNDARGHSAGDRVLQQVGVALSEQVRIKDVVYRYGGEEFCVLLPNADQADAMIVAERIRAATSRLEIGDSASVTVSVGVALGSGADVMATLDRADAALYDAKRDGRDRVSLAA